VRYTLLFTALLLTVLPGCGRTDDSAATQTSPLSSCQDEEAQIEAVKPAGFDGKKRAIVPMGRRLTPAGILVDVGYFPLGVRVSPDGAYAYVVHSGLWKLEVIDIEQGKVVQTVPGVGGFRGIALTADGQTLFTGESGNGTVSRLVRQNGQLRDGGHVELVGAPTTVALTRDESRLIAVSAPNSKVWELDPATLAIETEYVTAGVYPYAALTTPDDQALLVTHVGGDTLTVIERTSGDILHDIKVGLNPMGLAVDTERNLAYVTNSDADSISVVSLDSFTVVKTVDVSFNHLKLPGSTPNEITVDPANEFAYVSFADLNRVNIYRLSDWRSVGAIPTAHYPTGLHVSADGSRLAITSSKGWGGAIKLKKETCITSFLELPIAPLELEKLTAQCEENVTRTTEFWEGSCEATPPLPLDQNEEPVIEHVVVIVRENKTYDAVMGDFERGNGDPALTVFGQSITPNIHEIADQFVNMDNYYADSQESFQGHTWTTQADCNDFFEKLYPSDPAQILLAGYDPSSVIGERTIFDHYFDHSITFRNYGEFEGFTKDLFDKYKEFINHKFPYYNMAIKDVWKAEEFVRELKLEIFPQFVYIALPNDHTAGGKVGFPTPASMVADNDEATGMVVDAISHSPYWDSTIVFIIEDDPQGYGGDHVHAHRSICVVASPWVKREFTSSVHYSIPAMYRTIELLFRLPPMHTNNALAPAMHDIFVAGTDDDPPDYSPYVYVPRLSPERFNEPDGRLAEESEKFDFSRPDAAPGLGEIIWRIQKGDVIPPPYAKWNDR
jgi:DNA-binding beta-propeller fold protein YncE